MQEKNKKYFGLRRGPYKKKHYTVRGLRSGQGSGVWAVIEGMRERS